MRRSEFSGVDARSRQSFSVARAHETRVYKACEILAVLKNNMPRLGQNCAIQCANSPVQPPGVYKCRSESGDVVDAPTYQDALPFAIQFVDLRFKSSRPFYARYAVKRAIGMFFNSCNYVMKELYEENVCYVFPCYEIRYLMKRIDKTRINPSRCNGRTAGLVQTRMLFRGGDFTFSL